MRGELGEKPSVTILLNISLASLVVFLVTRLMVSGVFMESYAPSVNKLIELFAALALLFWVLAVLVQGRVALALTGVRIPVLIFMLLTVISIAQAGYAFSASHTAATWLIHIGVFFLVINLSSDRRRRNVIVATVVATAIVVSFLAFYQYFFQFEIVQRYYNLYSSEIVVPEDARQQFLGRLHLDEAFGTFIQSNIFGGYLIMVLPLLFFLLHAAARACRRPAGNSQEPAGKNGKDCSVSPVTYWQLATGSLAVGCVAAAVALYLTGSRGAWLGLLGGAALFALGYWVHRRPAEKRRKARLYVILGIAAFVVLVVVIMLAVGYDRLPGSAKVRLGYWHAGLRMAAHNPFGVGAGNFQENYTVYQAPWATEVKNPHNSYLAIWTELGIAGLAAFVAILFLAGRRFMAALKGRADNCSVEPEKPGGRRLHLTMLLAGTAGFTLLAIIGAGLGGISLGGHVFGLVPPLWLLLMAGLLLSGKMLDSPLVPAGIALGLLAFCCHAFMDFDFYSHGVNATFWVLLGLILAECCRLERWRKAPEHLTRLDIALAVLVIAIVLFFGLIYMPHAMHADSQTRLAAEMRENALKKGFPKPMVLAAAAEFEAAQKLSHWNAENCSSAAWLYDELFRGVGDLAYAAKALENYARAIKLRRNSHYEYYRQGVLKFLAAETPEAARHAVADIETALALYPIKADYHYYLGEHLDMLSGRIPQQADQLRARARAHYKEAMRLDSVVAFPRGRLRRSHRRILKLRFKR